MKESSAKGGHPLHRQVLCLSAEFDQLAGYRQRGDVGVVVLYECQVTATWRNFECCWKSGASMIPHAATVEIHAHELPWRTATFFGLAIRAHEIQPIVVRRKLRIGAFACDEFERPTRNCNGVDARVDGSCVG